MPKYSVSFLGIEEKEGEGNNNRTVYEKSVIKYIFVWITFFLIGIIGLFISIQAAWNNYQIRLSQNYSGLYIWVKISKYLLFFKISII